MNTTHNMRRIFAGALLSGGVVVAGLGLGAGAAQADDCIPARGGCWCPGMQLPLNSTQITWDMGVCHKFHEVRGPNGQWEVLEGWGPPSPGFPWP